MSTFFRWASRTLAILFALFLSVFAFSELRHGAVAVLMQSLPALLVLLALAIAWKHERVGAAIFLALGAAYVAIAWGRFVPVTLLVIAGPLVLAGMLFFASAWSRARWA